MAKQSGYNTYIGYQQTPVKPRINFNAGLEAFQAAQLGQQKQKQKQLLDAEKTFAKTTANLYDFTSGISPNYQQFIATSVSDLRNAQQAQFKLLANEQDTPSHYKMYANNMHNQWEAYMLFGKNFEKNLKMYADREQGDASPLETGYFALKFADQSVFDGKKIVADNDGNLWNVKYDANGKVIESETLSVNELNNIQALTSDKVTFSDYTKQFSKNIKQWKTTKESKTGVVTTLQGLAMHAVPGDPSGKQFLAMYDKMVKQITESMLTNPNQAAAALSEHMNTNGVPYFFYDDKSTGGGKFMLNGRNEEEGIFMQKDSDLHIRAQLTDKQKKLLEEYVKDNLNAQLGFTSSSRIDPSTRKAWGKTKERALDISQALLMRAGDETAWNDAIISWNKSSTTKDGEKITSYRVAPDGIYVAYAEDHGTETKMNLKPFTGKAADYATIKSDISKMLGILAPDLYKNPLKANEAFEDGKDYLPPGTIMDDFKFKGTRGAYTGMSDADHAAMVADLSFVPSIPGQTGAAPVTNIATNLNRMIERLDSELYNFDPTKQAGYPVSGTGGSIIVNAKGEYKDASGWKTFSDGSTQINLGGGVTSNFTTSPNTAEARFTIKVKGGPNGTDIQEFVFHPAPLADVKAKASASLTQRNEKVYRKMLNFIKEPMRSKGDYGLGFSDFYEDGIFNIR